MIDAQQRFGTRETFASKVDFRLVPDLKPIQIQGFSIDLGVTVGRPVDREIRRNATLVSWVIRMLTSS